jgi:hypothetical protein
MHHTHTASHTYFDEVLHGCSAGPAMKPSDIRSALGVKFAKHCLSQSKVQRVARGEYKNCVCIPVDFVRLYCLEKGKMIAATKRQVFCDDLTTLLENHPPFVGTRQYRSNKHFYFVWGRADMPDERDIVSMFKIRDPKSKVPMALRPACGRSA